VRADGTYTHRKERSPGVRGSLHPRREVPIRGVHFPRSPIEPRQPSPLRNERTSTAMRRILTLTTSLMLATGCGQGPDELALGSAEQAIVNGTPSDDADNTAVYVFTRPEGVDPLYCTGTVIAPNLVATALHCITKSRLGTFSCNPDGSISSDSVSVGRMGALVDPADVTITAGPTIIDSTPSAYGIRLFGSGSTQICRGDIGFVVLDHDLDLPITPVRLDYGVETGDLVDIVGYGETEEVESSGRHRRTGVRIIDVGPASEEDTSITAAPRTFVTNEGACHGDSGGPAIAQNTGALVGVYSLTAGTSCTGIGIRNVYTSLNLYSNLALQAFDAAGAEPILDEAPPEAEKPHLVPESGCSIGVGASPASSATGLATAIVALALGLVARRRRAGRTDAKTAQSQ
jgi:trypsin